MDKNFPVICHSVVLPTMSTAVQSKTRNQPLHIMVTASYPIFLTLCQPQSSNFQQVSLVTKFGFSKLVHSAFTQCHKLSDRSASYTISLRFQFLDLELSPSCNWADNSMAKYGNQNFIDKKSEKARLTDQSKGPPTSADLLILQRYSQNVPISLR